ncbi:hypothetical protein BH23GEM6_BH23GEM6_11190 [soil metagenome]
MLERPNKFHTGLYKDVHPNHGADAWIVCRSPPGPRCCSLLLEKSRHRTVFREQKLPPITTPESIHSSAVQVFHPRLPAVPLGSETHCSRDEVMIVPPGRDGILRDVTHIIPLRPGLLRITAAKRAFVRRGGSPEEHDVSCQNDQWGSRVNCGGQGSWRSFPGAGITGSLSSHGMYFPRASRSNGTHDFLDRNPAGGAG